MTFRELIDEAERIIAEAQRSGICTGGLHVDVRYERLRPGDEPRLLIVLGYSRASHGSWRHPSGATPEIALTKLCESLGLVPPSSPILGLGEISYSEARPC